MDIGIIGGADGPTAVFVTSNGSSWLDLPGLVIVLLILIPDIIYAIKVPRQQNLCTSRVMNLLEQIGRYGCMALTVFRFLPQTIGISFLLPYFVGTAAMLAAYWICWLFWFRRKTKAVSLLLALLPTGCFLLHGFFTGNVLLILFAFLFGTGHIYVTLHNV